MNKNAASERPANATGGWPWVVAGLVLAAVAALLLIGRPQLATALIAVPLLLATAFCWAGLYVLCSPTRRRC